MKLRIVCPINGLSKKEIKSIFNFLRLNNYVWSDGSPLKSVPQGLLYFAIYPNEKYIKYRKSSIIVRLTDYFNYYVEYPSISKLKKIIPQIEKMNNKKLYYITRFIENCNLDIDLWEK